MRRKQSPIAADEQLEAAVQRALAMGISLTDISKRANIDRVTLWKWRTQKASPVMSVRQEVLDAIEALIEERRV